MIRLAGYLILTLSLDLLLRFEVQGMTLAPNLTLLLLMFLALRKSAQEIFVGILCFMVLIHPFTGVSFIVVFLSYWIVLSLMHRLRAKVFAESYIVHAFWIFVFSFLLQTILTMMIRQTVEWTKLQWIFPEAALNSLITALLTIPCFVLWDERTPVRRERMLEFESGW